MPKLESRLPLVFLTNFWANWTEWSLEIVESVAVLDTLANSSIRERPELPKHKFLMKTVKTLKKGEYVSCLKIKNSRYRRTKIQAAAPQAGNARHHDAGPAEMKNCILIN